MFISRSQDTAFPLLLKKVHLLIILFYAHQLSLIAICRIVRNIPQGDISRQC